MKKYYAFMDKYYPDGDKYSSFNSYGYSAAELMAKVLKGVRRQPHARGHHENRDEPQRR